MRSIKVANATELLSAIGNASGDTTITLASGNYGHITLNGNTNPFLNSAASLTLKSEDATNPASFSGLDVKNFSNLTFDGVEFDYTANSGAILGVRPFIISQGSNLKVVNSTFDGDLASGTNSVNNGYGTGIALAIDFVDNTVVQNNVFTDFYKAVVVGHSTNVDVVGNDVSKMSSDGICFVSTKNLLIEGNNIHDFHADPNTASHKDMIQFWTNNSTTATTDVIIRGNILDSGSGTWTQTILVKNNLGSQYDFKNFTIEDNLIHNAFIHGISIAHTDGLVIKGNTLLQNRDSAPDAAKMYIPKIILAGSTSNVEVSNNITAGISNTGWTGSNNLIVQNTNPGSPNYTGDLLVNAFAGAQATANDLHAVPGGIIEQMQVGSSFTHSGPQQPLTPTPVPVNIDPTAHDDLAHTDASSTIVVDVLANDFDPDGNGLSVISISSATSGIAAITSDGKIKYSPDATFSGTETLTYTISDGNGGSATALLSIDVASVSGRPNTNPVTQDDVGNTTSDQSVIIDVLNNDYDLDGDTLRITTISTGLGGTASITPQNQILYMPHSNFEGVDVLNYSISDGSGGIGSATLSINVSSPVLQNPNSAPIAHNDIAATTNDTTILIDALANDTDDDGDTLTIVSVASAKNGVASVSNENKIEYIPNTGFVGTDSFLYEIYDGNGGYDHGIMTINVSDSVRPANHDPEANDDALQTLEGLGTTFNLLTNDTDWDGDVLYASITEGPTNGTASLTPDGFLSYTPLAGFNGADQIKYLVEDGNGGSDFAIAYVAVVPNQNAFEMPIVEYSELSDSTDNVRFFNRSADYIFALGGDDRIRTTGGDDIVDGGLGNDTVRAGNGDDLVVGGHGNDKLFGGNGSDILAGGAGRDIMRGNYKDKPGADIFVFTSQDIGWVDRIIDFRAAEGDQIDLSGLMIGADTPGADPTTLMQLTQIGGGSMLSVDLDGDGNYTDLVRIDGLQGISVGDLVHDNSLVLI